MAYRLCLGLLNLSRKYLTARLNLSGRIANKEGLIRLKQIKSILRSNRDQLPEQLSLATELPQDHENIRGPNSFHEQSVGLNADLLGNRSCVALPPASMQSYGKADFGHFLPSFRLIEPLLASKEFENCL